MVAKRGWELLLRPAGRRILAALADGSTSLTQIAEATKLSKASLLPHLNSLVELGVVARKERKTETGREVDFALAGGSLHVEIRRDGPVLVSWAVPGDAPVFPYVAQVKDEGLRREVDRCVEATARVLASDSERAPHAILLFGSVARDEATWKSDIDLLVIAEATLSETTRRAVADALADLSDTLEHRARVQFTTVASFLEGRKSVEREAARDGILLHDSTQGGTLWPKIARYKRISL